MRRLVEEWVTKFVRMEATDVHFVPEERRVRLLVRNGQQLDELEPLEKGRYEVLVSHMRYLANMKEQNERVPQTGRYPLESGGIRIALLPTKYGEAMSWRLYRPNVNVSSAEGLLRASGHLTWIQDKQSGCIVISGTTGAGKTTLLYSILQAIKGKRVISIEDPVESDVAGVLQLELNEKAGVTAERYFEEVLRADPDWIAFGEVRSKAAAKLSMNAALSGHVVVFTLHAGSIGEAKQRLRSLGITQMELEICDCFIHVMRQEGEVRCIVERSRSVIKRDF
ncbi:ATPase, T2SS/T4P/T4SS family [Exiguobacterium flavidum]|uniref:ATPase, T2SS/T4P/T4SS family n=1 Tax=Exiguobacterium flavidum TaxID=2184695 RepID=UPI000DF773B4|nr:ATPase, T2SS/T4P/T4SS family [Exiguobacterium flavidum]